MLKRPSAVQILDELIIAGELQESSKKAVLRVVRPECALSVSPPSSRTFCPPSQVAQSDTIEEAEVQEDTLARLGSLASR